MDREVIKEKVDEITKEFGDKLTPIHLVWGDLSPKDLNNLYNHPKVKGQSNVHKRRRLW